MFYLFEKLITSARNYVLNWLTSQWEWGRTSFHDSTLYAYLYDTSKDVYIHLICSSLKAIDCEVACSILPLMAPQGSSPSENGHGSPADYKYGRFDHTALHIAHALNATKLHKKYLRVLDRPIDSYLVSTGGKLRWKVI